MTIPHATYRLQLRDGMTFERAAALVPYLRSLGVSHLYASPLFAATAGSTHGYDVTDFGRLDPTLGGEVGFERLSDALREAGMGLLLDIVPNHMAAHAGNPWWRNVLKWGVESPYARYFDIDWSERLTLPVLGASLEDVLARRELAVVLLPEGGELGLSYFEAFIPMTPRSYALALGDIDQPLARTLLELATAATPGTSARFHDEVRQVLHAAPDLALLQAALAALPEAHRRIRAIHEAQPWQLIDWHDARRRLTYRRFFEVTGLVGLRIEDPEVFDDVHRLCLDLVRRDRVDGFRIDHIDGLADPRGYLERLRREVGQGTYLVVEKILAQDERLPASWPVAGTTGYEFVADLAGVLVDTEQAEILDKAYRECLGRQPNLETQRAEVKSRILRHNFEGELETLTGLALAALPPETGVERRALRDAIVELTVALPVYRTYGDRTGQSERDRMLLEAIAGRLRHSQSVTPRDLDLVLRLLLLEVPPAQQPAALSFLQRWQQTTGAVMAKAVEDTLFYRHNRLIALNEVGGDPRMPAGGVAEFHRRMQARAMHCPAALTATTTHDTKRAEDARARLYAISEAPRIWAAAVARWRHRHRDSVVELRAGPAPDSNTEWLLYQALLGIWSLDLQPDDRDGLAGLRRRFAAYLEKALREAKSRTDWTSPDGPYEQAVQDYAARLLSPDNAEFLADFAETTEHFVRAGALNALSQSLLKLTVPGVPDIYQGTESWDLSLVDPDNRRAVDFDTLADRLAGLAAATPEDLVVGWRSGRIKQHLLACALAARRAFPNLFALGAYEPLEVQGAAARHLLAFRRRHGDAEAIVIVPRLSFSLLGDQDGLSIPAARWRDTAVVLEETGPLADAFTGTVYAAAGALAAADVLRRFPVALLLPPSGED